MDHYTKGQLLIERLTGGWDIVISKKMSISYTMGSFFVHTKNDHKIFKYQEVLDLLIFKLKKRCTITLK